MRRIEVTEGRSFSSLASLIVVGRVGFLADIDFVGWECADCEQTSDTKAYDPVSGVEGYLDGDDEAQRFLEGLVANGARDYGNGNDAVLAAVADDNRDMIYRDEAMARVVKLAQQIASINEQIAKTKGTGHTPNDLLDKREQMISQLGEYVAVTTLPADDDTVGVFIGGGQRLVLGGQAIAAQSPVPPNTHAYDPGFKSEASDYDPARANALLDTYGYKDVDGDGWREPEVSLAHVSGREVDFIRALRLRAQEQKLVLRLHRARQRIDDGFVLRRMGQHLVDQLVRRRIADHAARLLQQQNRVAQRTEDAL